MDARTRLNVTSYAHCLSCPGLRVINPYLLAAESYALFMLEITKLLSWTGREH